MGFSVSRVYTSVPGHQLVEAFPGTPGVSHLYLPLYIWFSFLSDVNFSTNNLHIDL